MLSLLPCVPSLALYPVSCGCKPLCFVVPQMRTTTTHPIATMMLMRRTPSRLPQEVLVQTIRLSEQLRCRTRPLLVQRAPGASIALRIVTTICGFDLRACENLQLLAPTRMLMRLLLVSAPYLWHDVAHIFQTHVLGHFLDILINLPVSYHTPDHAPVALREYTKRLSCSVVCIGADNDTDNDADSPSPGECTLCLWCEVALYFRHFCVVASWTTLSIC